MMKKMLLIFLTLALFYPCFSQIKTQHGSLYDDKNTVYKFGEQEFQARLMNNYKTIQIQFHSAMHNKDFYLNCDSYIELLTIKQIRDNLYWFYCESLGFEQYFIWNSTEEKLYEPFFDMKQSVSIRKIDYENQVLFGDSWNSDKGIMPDSKIELYLFSTSKQEHYKIAEKYGDTFSIELLENNKVQYSDKNGDIIEFDYSQWVIPNTFYTASSFLREGKTQYSPGNLAYVEGLPWASANGYGINESIQIETTFFNKLQLKFYNGFQSKNRPDLYSANSRAKKIKIVNLENGNTQDFFIKDTSSVQIISLSELNINQNSFVKLELTILEVYPGEKYKDLCIQAIIPES